MGIAKLAIPFQRATSSTGFMVLTKKTISHNRQQSCLSLFFPCILCLSVRPTKPKVVPLSVGKEVNGPISFPSLKNPLTIFHLQPKGRADVIQKQTTAHAPSYGVRSVLSRAGVCFPGVGRSGSQTDNRGPHHSGM
jgi:hypothetical protein